ncbi:hypothetical protein DPEC_G00113740 [Dallia pectoralis]|uniref:Uncharacterized protein n=1 Tax=Dallia pectoralis TaxID=75939 RepID=A0ACC2GTP2_DALPE|nr:hypothetical protein DPEC_G00113740 [Dallia pectoralis]
MVALFWSPNCQGCSHLHLCKRFLLGECPFAKRRGGCRFNHQLTSEDNREILKEHGLEELDLAELRTLLLQNDNFFLPPVCHNYNNGAGEYGRCVDGEACKRLHICENFIRGSCSCPKCHDFYEPHPLKTLQDKGIPNPLIASLRSVYLNIERLQKQDRANQGKCQNSRGSRPTRPKQTGPAAATANTSRSGQDKTEICMYFIKGSCIHGDKCFKVHSTMPYQWEERVENIWTALKDNEEIEKDFCNPAKTYSRCVQPACFDTMTRGLNKVRRLSTVSSVLQPTFILTTEWTWFWENEFGRWIPYASTTAGHSSATVTSECLEQRFQEDNQAAVEFNAGSQTYKLSFLDMIQTNKQYGTKKVVRRRPVFVSLSDAQTIKTSKKVPYGRQNFRTLPESWDKTQVLETGYKTVNLPSISEEFKEIQQLFSNTMRGFKINQIERIQNKALWEVFQWQMDLMKKNNRGRNVTQKKLFHGTDSKYLDAICLHNFDWRICGLNGTALGKGSYFARDAKYSHSYTGQSNTRSMFVCRVLAGDYTKGHSSYLRPPSKDGGDIIFYDSCVDDVINPSIFVVFEKHQVYPEYLVHYTEDVSWSSVYQPYPLMAGSSFSRFSSRPIPFWTSSRIQVLMGLRNYGLSCCVNALLQSFSATWELVDLLDRWSPNDKDNESVPLKLNNTLKAMQCDQPQPTPHKDFLHCLDRHYISVHVQQDAVEVFLSVLNFIQQQMSDKTLAQEIQRLYKVEVETYLQCIECENICSGTSFFVGLPLTIKEGGNSLEDCVRFFFELQELRDTDKGYCVMCGEKKPSKHGLKLISLPPVLCIHLKRFRSCRGYTRKLHCQVAFPETLNISEILPKEALSKDYVHQSDIHYNLYAVVVHLGGDAMFGHYTAYVRHKKDFSWYYADDSHVRQVSWQEVLNAYGGSQREGTAYMLLYRQTTRTAPESDRAE